MKLLPFLLAALASAQTALAGPPQRPAAPPQCPAAAPCVSCSPCECKAGVCPACPAASALHVSPDGAVNELCPDGVYRPIPGAPKATPAKAQPVAAPPLLPYSPLRLPASPVALCLPGKG